MKKYFFAVLLLLAPCISWAASQSYVAKVKYVRVEGNYGFVGMEGELPWAEQLDCSGERFWIDLNNEVDRIKYSTALAAMMTKKRLYVRVQTSSDTKIFGACKNYDLMVYAD